MIISVTRFPRIALDSLNLRQDRINNLYQIEQAGPYAIFRETVNSGKVNERPVVVAIFFQLKLIGSNSFFHWLFQRCCILTTPFWSGFQGFRIKLWMVNPENKNYLGIYEWSDEQKARIYVHFLIPILRFFAVKNSVWYKLYPDKKIDDYLNSCKQ